MKKNGENEIKNNSTTKKSSLGSRLKTAIIVLPILFTMFLYPFFYLILMILVIYFSHKEFYIISTHIVKNLFSDQFSDSTASTLLSSTLQTYIILLLPILNYKYKDSELFVTFFVLILLLLHRITSFINIYMLNNTKDFESQDNFQVEKEFKEAINENGIKKLKNPMPVQPNIYEKMNKYTNIMKTNLENNKNLSLQMNQKETNFKIQSNALNENNQIEENSKFTRKSTITSFKNSHTKQYITEKMFNACLIIIELDFIFIFIYAIPLCYGISLHHLGVGFEYVSLTVMIAYTCDAGALFSGMKFGKKNFGAPITPTKTIEGLYGGIVFALFSSIIFRFVMMSLLHKKFFDVKTYIIYLFLELFTSVFGDMFESFLKRCGNIKDSGIIFPGHGGLLDRIDSITLGLPISYFFVKKYLYS
jgi:CDP-diglyceride synthetase